MPEPLALLSDDEKLALKLLADAPDGAVLLLPCDLDAALCELENRGFAEIIEPAGIPLAAITPEGRDAQHSIEEAADA